MSAADTSGDALSFGALIDLIKQALEALPDPRRGRNGIYRMQEVALAAFSVFWTQSASFLEFQRNMQQRLGSNNACTIFGLERVPSDNQVRNILDLVDPQRLAGVFGEIFERLEAAGHLQAYRRLDERLLIALDGTQYHSSERVHCEQCSRSQSGETVRFSHSVLTPVVVALGQSRVIGLAPEFIVPQDGHAKQDGESAAALRWIGQHGAALAARRAVLLGDDLYSRQPMCQAVLGAGLDFLFVAKPSSHKCLYEWLQGLEQAGAVEQLQIARRQGKRLFTDTYRFARQLPLRDGKDALQVSWCELSSRDEQGKALFHNAWVSSLPIDAHNVAAMVEAGRARWKVENENNNTLKTKGYHFEHNFGHGKRHLSATLASLNLLAFLTHSVLELHHSTYQALREACGPRRTFFNDLRTLLQYLSFASLEALFQFMLHPPGAQRPNTS